MGPTPSSRQLPASTIFYLTGISKQCHAGFEMGNTLAVRLYQVLVNALGLKAGDEFEVVAATPGRVVVRKDDSRTQAADRMRSRAWPVPDGYAFDRDEANAR